MHNFSDISFSDLIKSVASDEPTTGGGCASALSASIGVGLIRMAIAITEKSSKLNGLEKYSRQLEKLNSDLIISASQDSALFDKYMTAIALPKTNDAEIAKRKDMLYITSTEATESPLNISKLILDGIEVAEKISPSIKKSIISDLYAGTELLYGALTAVLLNVDINLKSKVMEEKRAFYFGEKNSIQERAWSLMSSIRNSSLSDGFSRNL